MEKGTIAVLTQIAVKYFLDQKSSSTMSVHPARHWLIFRLRQFLTISLPSKNLMEESENKNRNQKLL